MKIRKIELVFENCEIISLMPDNIEMLELSNIKKDININYHLYGNNDIHPYYVPSEVFLILTGLNNQQMERILSSRDITQIHTYTRHSHYCYLIEWASDNDSFNAYQTNAKLTGGKLSISILS